MKSAFVEWADPPPKTSKGGRYGPREFDSALLVMDLMREPGRWALTSYHHPGHGSQLVQWCETRGIRAETAMRDRQVYARVFA